MPAFEGVLSPPKHVIATAGISSEVLTWLFDLQPLFLAQFLIKPNTCMEIASGNIYLASGK